MVTLESLRRERRAEILRLAEVHGCRNIRVFGSVARGDSGDNSDVDFLVDIDQGRTLFDLAGLTADLRDLLGVDVDVITPGSLRYTRTRILGEATPL